jgi:hypothetical protein
MSGETKAFDATEKIDILIKTAFGFPTTDERRAWYEETTVPFNNYIIGEDILIDKIPTNPDFNTNGIVRDASYVGLTSTDFVNYYANTVDKSLCSIVDDATGVIRRIRLLILDETPQLATPGVSWYKLNSKKENVIKDAFQFNYNRNIVNDNVKLPYLYAVNTQKSPIETLPFGEMGGNWLIDFKVGILLFPDFGNFTTSQTDPVFQVNATDNKPVLTIYTYIGRKGTPKMIDFGDDAYRGTLSAQNNQIFVNTTNNTIERYSNNQWISIGGSTESTLSALVEHDSLLDISVNSLIAHDSILDTSVNELINDVNTLEANLLSPSFVGPLMVTVGDVSFNSKLFVKDDVSMNKNLNIGGDLIVNGNLSVFRQENTSIINTTISNYEIVITKDISLNGNLSIASNASLNNKLYVKNDASFNGRVDICGNLYAKYPNTSIPVSAIIDGVTLYYVNNSLTSVSPTFTGTITATDLSLSGNVNVNSKLTVNSDALFNGRLVQWSG